MKRLEFCIGLHLLALRVGVYSYGNCRRIRFDEFSLVKEQGLGEENDDKGCGHSTECDGWSSWFAGLALVGKLDEEY